MIGEACIGRSSWWAGVMGYAQWAFHWRGKDLFLAWLVFQQESLCMITTNLFGDCRVTHNVFLSEPKFLDGV
jgi:hypothetical protein